MDTIRSLLHDGLDGSLEALDLLPQRLQTGQVVIQVNHRHLGARMCLGVLKKNELSRGGEQINRTTVAY